MGSLKPLCRSQPKENPVIHNGPSHRTFGIGTESLWHQGTLGSHMGPSNWQNGYYHQAQECPTSLRALDVMNCKIMDSHPWTPDFQGQQYQECPIWHTTRRQHLYFFWWSHSKMYRCQRVPSHLTTMHLSIRSSVNFY